MKNSSLFFTLLLAVAHSNVAFAENTPSITVSDSEGGNGPENTIDGSLATYWSSPGKGAWIQYDFGQAVKLDSLQIAFENGDKYKYSFTIESSANGTSWKKLFSSHSSGKTSKLEEFESPDTVLRYVRYVGEGNNENSNNKIEEVKFKLLDYKPTSPVPPVTPPPKPTPPPVAPPPPPVAPPLPPTSGGTLPSSILPLANFKLTLPLDKSGLLYDQSGSVKNGAVEVQQPALNNYSNPLYFHVDPSDSSVVFRAPVDGVTTEGSFYPRSELREMNGSQEASWATNDGYVHTMDLVESFTHLPVVKPQDVCAQIHDASSDTIEVYIAANILSVKYNNDKSLALLDSNYVLGTKFHITIVASSGVITVFYNGVLKLTYPLIRSGLYFKAGDYTQASLPKCASVSGSACDSPTAYGESKIYSLKVTHVKE